MFAPKIKAKGPENLVLSIFYLACILVYFLSSLLLFHLTSHLSAAYLFRVEIMRLSVDARTLDLESLGENMKTLLALICLSSQSWSLDTGAKSMNITEELVKILHSYQDEIHCIPDWFRNEWTHKSFHKIVKENKRSLYSLEYNLKFCLDSDQQQINSSLTLVNETVELFAMKVGIDKSRFSTLSTR